MCAKWVDNEDKSRSFVEALLPPIRDQFVFNDDGGIAGTNIGLYQDFQSAIKSYIRFNSEVPEFDKNALLGTAIWSAAKDRKLDAENLLEYVRSEEGKYLRNPKEKYEFLSSLSVKYFKGLKRKNIIFTARKPKKFDFESVVSRFSYVRPIPESYSFVRVSVDARNPREAYQVGIDAVDLLRSYWNWFHKPQEYIFNSDQTRAPLNRITLGPIHTIVKTDGHVDEEFWYEPEFNDRAVAVEISATWPKLTSFERRSRGLLRNHPYKRDVENAMRRFVRALDHYDKHVSFLHLWQVLEKVTGINNAEYEKLVKRVAFLNEDVELTKGVVNHLRMCRNLSVHDGLQHHQIEKYVFQVKRYVQQVMGWHFQNPFKATSLADAVSYLDLPADSSILREKMTQFRKVIKFRLG